MRCGERNGKASVQAHLPSPPKPAGQTSGRRRHAYATLRTSSTRSVDDAPTGGRRKFSPALTPQKVMRASERRCACRTWSGVDRDQARPDELIKPACPCPRSRGRCGLPACGVTTARPPVLISHSSPLDISCHGKPMRGGQGQARKTKVHAKKSQQPPDTAAAPCRARALVSRPPRDTHVFASAWAVHVTDSVRKPSPPPPPSFSLLARTATDRIDNSSSCLRKIEYLSICPSASTIHQPAQPANQVLSCGPLFLVVYSFCF
jgi:hypothetical protein